MLTNNLQVVQDKIRMALQKRKNKKITGSDVTLVAVTKNHPPEVIEAALALGIKDIGENRVQEAKHKKEVLPTGGCWHLIGHLQSNKVRHAVGMFDIIESVDSLHLLAEIDKEAGRIGKVQEILLQLNIADEKQKFGFSKNEYLKALTKLDDYRYLRIRGIMVIAHQCDDIEETRPVFASGYRIYCDLKAARQEIDILSMGMSGDYTVAVEEGANTVRVGTALFGQRDYNLKF
ncbi:MAG: YggS family pyridoxal phosphate-dependent enzyme [Phascolarctobacterium sp.]|nr:YggS family pyridoxal phosphate-dependent enzyme [Phascolarctobacterium sp.]